MAGINNFNLGNNLKLQQTQQLKATVNVDTQKAEGKEVGDAKKSAVWLHPDFWRKLGFEPPTNVDYKVGDCLEHPGGNTKIVAIRDDGTLVLEFATNEEYFDALEYDRGDVRKK